jgi:phenylacetate-CoA ligase
MSLFASKFAQWVEVARAELSRQTSRAPSFAFYEPKLRAAWERARASAAYRNIGSFDERAFFELPVTGRQALKEHPLDFVAAPVQRVFKYYETTGTTGRATPTPRLREDVVWNTVSVAEAWRAIIEHGDRVLILLPSDIVPVADLVVGVCEYLDVAHAKAYPFTTGISDWDRIDALSENFDPTVLFIAPGVAQLLTRVLKQRGTFERFSRNVRALMLLGEVNTAAFRARLADWWGAAAFDASYGSTETGTLAASCSHDHQHLLTSASYFELAVEGGLVPLPSEGEAHGRLVVTPLNLHARPLLRLDTGDLVTVSVGCSCGALAPRVMVHGRASDAIQIHGRQVTPRALEEVVYAVTDATGYLLEVSEDGARARLILERGADWDRGTEHAATTALQRLSKAALELEWDAVVYVNALPMNTKSGASQKSWKRSNVRWIKAQSA